MTRVSLSALAGAAVLAGGLFAASAPVQAACVGIASCANGGGNRFATGPGAVRPGAPAFKPTPGLNGGKLIGQDGGSLMGRGSAGILNPGNVNPGFRGR